MLSALVALCILELTSSQETSCPIPQVEHGYVRVNIRATKDRIGTAKYQVIVTCEEGFVSTTGNILTCGTTGTWSPPVPKCQRPEANRLKRAAGSRTLVSTGNNKIPAPFRKQRDSESADGRCDGSGSGLGTQRCRTPQIDHSTLQPLPDDTGMYAAGRLVNVICDPGYRLWGTDELICFDQGNWGAELPTCLDRKMCPKIILPMGCLQPVKEKYEPGSTVTIRCPADYYPRPPTITCTEHGAWSEEPDCAKDAPRKLRNRGKTGGIWPPSSVIEWLFWIAIILAVIAVLFILIVRMAQQKKAVRDAEKGGLTEPLLEKKASSKKEIKKEIIEDEAAGQKDVGTKDTKVMDSDATTPNEEMATTTDGEEEQKSELGGEEQLGENDSANRPYKYSRDTRRRDGRDMNRSNRKNPRGWRWDENRLSTTASATSVTASSEAHETNRTNVSSRSRRVRK